LRRRSQRTRINWARMDRLAARWLPPAKILHPYPVLPITEIPHCRSPKFPRGSSYVEGLM
jgi:hypothetical protein